MDKRYIAAALCVFFVGCSRVPQPMSSTESTQMETTVQTEQTTQTEQPVQTEPTMQTGQASPTEPVQTSAPTQQTEATEPDQTSTPTQQTEETLPVDAPLQTTQGIKAIWLTQFDLSDVYGTGKSQRSEKDFTEKTRVILQNIRDMGFDTVFLQIRPNADSMYPSAYFPMSKYVVGEYGKQADYDPVALLVQLARETGLSIHAWINPLRGMKEEELALVGAEYPIGQWATDEEKLGTYLVPYNGMWYLNPAYPEVRKLIADGAREALERYGFDGLHIDDYFYPTTEESFDARAFADMGGGRTLAEFRRQSLNALVGLLYETAHGQGAVFGVSPAGNINTVYNSHYADVYTWCSQPGYVDYLCPQVYFGLEHEKFDFASVCRTYADIISREEVVLLVGMTFGKAFSGEDPYAGTGKNEWKEHKDVL